MQVALPAVHRCELALHQCPGVHNAAMAAHESPAGLLEGPGAVVQGAAHGLHRLGFRDKSSVQSKQSERHSGVRGTDICCRSG